MTTRNVVKVAVISLLALGPWAADRLLSITDRGYDEITLKYECEAPKCEADFDGDGVAGRLERVVDQSSVPPGYFLSVKDGGRELIRLPHSYVDGTLRTHVAIRPKEGGASLLIYDGTAGRSTAWSAVYSWDGRALSPATPSREDRAIIAAMMARDDSGTWGGWAMYRTFSLTLLLGYYLLLAGAVVGYSLRAFSKRARPGRLS